MTAQETPRNIPAVPAPSEQRLNRAQLDIYRDWREDFLEWLQTEGKKPDEGEGYARSTVRRIAHDTDRFARWVWDREGGFTKNLTTDHANDYLYHVRDRDLSDTAKARSSRHSSACSAGSILTGTR